MKNQKETDIGVDIDIGDNFRFRVVRFGELSSVSQGHPAVSRAIADRLHGSLKNNPFIYESFPCFAYIEDIKSKKIVSSIGAYPDKGDIRGLEIDMAWTGAIATDPEYQGRGLASKLVEQINKVLHQSGIFRGSVFSTPVSLHIHRKGGAWATYCERRFWFRNFEVALRHVIKTRILRNILCFFPNAIMKFILVLYVFFLKIVFRFNLEKIDFKKCGPDQFSHQHYRACIAHFCDNYRMLEWKMGHSSNDAVYFIKDPVSRENLAYLIIRSRMITKPFAGKFKDFKMMTLMSFGFFSNDKIGYREIVRASMSVFIKGDADVLDVVSSSPEFNRAARRYGMLRIGKGMSFSFTPPRDLKDGIKGYDELDHWHLTHYHGDGFSFE